MSDILAKEGAVFPLWEDQSVKSIEEFFQMKKSGQL